MLYQEDYDEELVAEEDAPELPGVLSAVLPQTSTAEAKAYAKRILDEGLNNPTSPMDSILGGMEDSAESTRKALQEARARLVALRVNPGGRWLSMAAGFGKPANSLGQTAGNVASSMLDYNKTTADAEAGKNKNLLDLDLAGINAGKPVVDARARLAEIQTRNKARLMEQALRTMGASTAADKGAAPAKSLSLIGKETEDAGYIKGTPEYTAEVQRRIAENQKAKQASAGIDVEEIDPETRNKIATTYGVPIAPDLGPGLSTKERQARRNIENRQIQKKLDDLAAQADVAHSDISDADRFIALNEVQRTGIVSGQFPSMSEVTDEMDSISTRLSRQMREKGEGSTSDFDARQFAKAIFSRTKKFEANKKISEAFKIRKQLVLEKQQYMSDYFAVNPDGTVAHAEAMWRKYLNSNTIFDPTAPGRMVLNPNRKTYQEYFGRKVEAKASGGKVGSAAKALKQVSKAMQGGEANVEDMLAGTKHLEGVPVESRERLNQLYQLMKDAEATGQDPLQHRDSLLSHLSEVYMSGSPSLRTSLSLPQQPPQLDTRPRLRSLRELVPGAFGTQKKAEGGSIEPSIPEGLLLSLLQGGSSGLSDELMGAGDAESLARHREKLRRFMSKYPVSAAAASTVGGLPLAMIPGGSSGILGMAGRGAVAGGAAGAGGGESVGDRAFEAGQSAVLGAPAGVLGGLAAKYGTQGALSLADRARGLPQITSADRRMVDAFERDKMNPSDVLAKLRAAYRQRVPSTIADEAGPNVRALAGATLGRDTEQSALMAEELASRQMGARGRVNDQINRGLKPSEYFGEMDKLKDELYTNAKPLYETAYANTPSIPYKTVSPILDNDFGRKALKDAVKLMRADGVAISKSAVMGTGKKAGVHSLNLQTLDYTKRALDDMINVEENQAPTNKGRILRGMRNRLVEQLDAASPDYKLARDQYAGDLEMVDALKAGKDEFTQLAPEEVRRKVAKMGFAERDAFRTGVAQSLYSMLDAPTTDVNAARRLVGSPAMMEKMEALFDKPAEFNIFKAALEREMKNFEHTKPWLTEASRMRKTTAGGGQSLLENIDPSLKETPGVGAISWLTRALNILRHQWPMTDDTANKIAEVLSEGDPKKASAALTKIEEVAVRTSKRKKLSGKAAIVGAAAAGALGRPEPLPQVDVIEEEAADVE